jgi:hypothetical protein
MKHSLLFVLAGLTLCYLPGCETTSPEPSANKAKANPNDPASLTDGTFIFKIKKVNGAKIIQSINGDSAAGYANTPLFKIVSDLINDAEKLFKTGLKEYGGIANLREGESTELTLRMKDGNVLM